MLRIARMLPTAVLFAALPAFQGGDRPDVDPPSRVGRLSFLGASVSFRPGDANDWTTATINYPLHGGDHLWTDVDARAEVMVGSTALRLAPQTAFGFLALDDHTTQVRLSQGSLSVRVRSLGDSDSFEIDTPNEAAQGREGHSQGAEAEGGGWPNPRLIDSTSTPYPPGVTATPSSRRSESCSRSTRSSRGRSPLPPRPAAGLPQ